jgi:hypothetical protein
LSYVTYSVLEGGGVESHPDVTKVDGLGHMVS